MHKSECLHVYYLKRKCISIIFTETIPAETDEIEIQFNKEAYYTVHITMNIHNDTCILSRRKKQRQLKTSHNADWSQTGVLSHLTDETDTKKF